jgi:hypothetical protein
LKSPATVHSSRRRRASAFRCNIAAAIYFIAADPLLARASFLFSRAKNEVEKDKPGPVVELMHGDGWYTNSKYSGPKTFP